MIEQPAGVNHIHMRSIGQRVDHAEIIGDHGHARQRDDVRDDFECAGACVQIDRHVRVQQTRC